MTTDAIIVGGGHNGLVCAAYLAKKGIRVKVLEKNHQVGGPASTEEFCPGFRNSVGAYTVSLLNPKVINDLELHQHGLTIVERKVNNLFPQTDGNFLYGKIADKKIHWACSNMTKVKFKNQILHESLELSFGLQPDGADLRDGRAKWRYWEDEVEIE